MYYQTPFVQMKMRGETEYVSKEEEAARFGATIREEEPGVPGAGEHIWDWFWSLSARRQSGFESTNPITYTEIQSWTHLTGAMVRPEEVKILARMDDAFTRTQAKIQKESRDKKK